MRWRRALTLCVVLSSAQHALGDPSSAEFDLTWEAPDRCPDRDEMRAEVGRLVGGGEYPRHQLTVVGRVIHHDDGQWVLKLETELDGMRGERVIAGQSCQAVSEAGALMLALALNPEIEVAAASTGASEPRAILSAEGPSAGLGLSAGTPVVPPAASARPVAGPGTGSSRLERGAPTPASPHPSRTWGPRVVAGVVRGAAGLRSGSLPRLGPEFGAFLGVHVDRAGMEAGAAYAPTQTSTKSTKEGPAGRLELWAFSSTMSYWFLDPPLGLAPRIGFDVSYVRGRGDGVANPESDYMYWTSVSWGGAAAVRLAESALWMRLDGALLVPLVRPEARIEGFGRIHRPDELAFQLGLGFEQRLRFRGPR